MYSLPKRTILELIRSPDRTKYVKEEVKLIEALPAPPPPPPVEAVQRTEIVIPPPEPAPVEIIRQQIVHTEEVAPPPPPSMLSGHTSHHSHSHDHGHGHRRRKSKRRKSRRRSSSSSSSSSSTHVEEIIIKKVEESEPVRGPFTGLGGHKDERTINKEIRALDREEKALEIEKKALKLERQRDEQLRKAERVREAKLESSGQVDLGGIRVERNKKGKMYMVKS